MSAARPLDHGPDPANPSASVDGSRRDVMARIARVATALAAHVESADQGENRAFPGDPAGSVLSLGWPEVDALLPDGGLPRGVVELTASRALGGATSVALAAVRAAHAKSAHAWCAWLDPEGTLYGPGAVRAGVDLARLLVVRPPRAELGRMAVKVAASRAFDVLVADMDVVGGGEGSEGSRQAIAPRSFSKKRRAWPPEVLVRKLALAAEEGGTTILLLTDANAPRAVSWPVALRIELARPNVDELSLRIAKERRGRIGLAKTVSMRSRPGLDAVS